MDRTSLEQLSKDKLIELVLRLQRPEKTSRTSSKPPSTDKKARRENARPGGAKAGHEPHNRKLCDDPDAFVDHMPETCAICGDPLISGAVGALIGSYDEIDIPPVLLSLPALWSGDGSTNAYHWVFHCKDAVVHQPDYSRAARVVEDVMNGHMPEVWTSDRYSAQQAHGIRQQNCLAHLVRDAAYAVENGSDDLLFRFKLWFDRVFTLARTIADLAPATLARKRRVLEKQLALILDATTLCDLAKKLQAKV
jgi:hypothetical protein